jgi:ubiquinone/menaquinone biosynthesis C-methylase UbiE
MATEAAGTVPLTPEPLMQMMQGMQATAIMQAGVRLAVFDQIADGKGDALAIAAGVGADERGTRILLDALVALGLLEKDGGYRLSPLADAFLVSTRPTYLGGMSDIMAGKWAWEAYPRLDEAVRRGGTILQQDAEVPGHEFWETFACSSIGAARPASFALAETLKPWAEQRESLDVLDIACGSGLFGLTLAAQYPQARVTLLDWPNVLALTRGNVEQMGLGERTSFIEGDVFDVALGGPYDLILASHIFHHFSERRCLELMRRLADALEPDGRLAINEFTAAGQQPAEEPFASLFSVIMLAWTREGEAYPLETYERMLTDAGFASPEVHESIGMPSRFLIAERSG